MIKTGTIRRNTGEPAARLLELCAPGWLAGRAVVTATLLVIGYIVISRVFMGAHYPTDAIAGYALGTAWAGTAYPWAEQLFERREANHVK